MVFGNFGDFRQQEINNISPPSLCHTLSLPLRHYTSFDVMKTQNTSNYSWFNDLGIIKKDASFMRKGTVGDWSNHLTPAQVERFQKEIEQPLSEMYGHHNPLEE